MPTIIDRLGQQVATQPGKRVFTFLRDGAEPQHVTYAELDLRARRVAAALRGLGDRARALLLLPHSTAFVDALFGCFHAGVCAVPGHVPTPSRLAQTLPRLRGIVADARPDVVITTSELLAARTLVPELASTPFITVDELDGRAVGDAGDRATADHLAILQYSSGSTGVPRGVIVSHANLMHNEALIEQAFEHSSSTVVMGWLPFQHDMGLIGNVLQPVYAGAECVMMSPIAFLKHPLSWLREISAYRATTSGAPNFAYEACVEQAARHGCDGIDLSSWSLAFVGAEPVRASTLERFARTFAPHGFRREAFYPCYGLAEATLMVSGGRRADRVRTRELGKVVRVGCGQSRPQHEIAVVEPEATRRVEDGVEGEIWVRGPSVARGYHAQPEQTHAVFHARIVGEAGEWLRTGDLGCLIEGELYVTGRLKDVVVVRGTKLAAEDIEQSFELDPVLRASACTAFAHDDGERERLVVVQEVERGAEGPFGEVAARIAAAILQKGGAPVDVVALVRAGNIPRTTSGKVRRSACRELFAQGTLDEIYRHTRHAT